MIRRLPAAPMAVAASVVLAAGPAWAGSFGGGVALPLSDTRDRFKTGWDAHVGFNYDVNPKVVLLLEGMYVHFNVTDAVLTEFRVPEGSGRILAGTLSVMVGPGASGSGLYAIAGGGVYTRNVEFSQPTTAATTILDPWFGFVTPTSTPSNAALGSYSTTRAGVNGGIGLSFGKSTRYYLEARYHYVFTETERTQFLPINLGVRW